MGLHLLATGSLTSHTDVTSWGQPHLTIPRNKHRTTRRQSHPRPLIAGQPHHDLYQSCPAKPWSPQDPAANIRFGTATGPEWHGSETIEMARRQTER